MRRTWRDRVLFRKDERKEFGPPALCADVIDGGVARTTIEIGALIAAALCRTLPQSQKNVVDQIFGGCPAATRRQICRSR